MVKVGLSTLFCLGKPFSKLLKNLHRFDVSCIEVVDDGGHSLNARRVDALRRAISPLDVELTIHSPFADINIASLNPAIRRISLRRLEKSILAAERLSCRLWVFHPGLGTGLGYFYPGAEWERNLESIRHLCRFGEEHGVRVAVENCPEPFPFLMRRVEDFTRFYNELGNNYDVGVVLDVGHAHISGQIHEFLERFQHRIVHIHVSDNDGRFDAHMGIGQGTINWREVADAIKKINYRGAVVLESVTQVKESLKTLRELFG